RVVHVGNAAFVHQVHDQLEFVQALEVGHFRRIAGFGQGLEAHLHQLHRATAQYGLLAKEVSLGLFTEVGFDHATLGAAIGGSIGKSQIASLAGLVLVDGDQRGHATTALVFRTHSVARALGGDHDHVEVSAGNDLVVVDIEAVGKSQGRARLDV